MRLCGMHSVLSIIVLYSKAHGNGVGCYFALCRGYAAALLRRMAVYWDSLVLFCTDAALPLGQGGWCVALRSVVPCSFGATFLRRCCRRDPPRGSLRRPRRDRGIASSPYSLLGFSGTPLYRRRSARGLEAAERCVLVRRSALLQRLRLVALSSVVALRAARLVLAPLWAAAAALWLPPAAKEG